MKKVLKIGGLMLGALLLLLGAAAATIHFRGIPSYEVKAPGIQVAPDSARVARGEYLVHQTCALCHLGPDGKLSGSLMEDNEFGTWYAPNITRHPDAAISAYTDGELIYLLRTGIKRDGKYAPPFMSKYNHLSDEDLYAIVAYLRSGDRLVQPSDVVQPAPRPSFLAKALCNLVFKPLPYPDGEISAPPTTDAVAYGKYLATGVFECYTCHSADFTKIDVINPERSEGYFGGGNHLLDNQTGETVLSSNLTMHPQYGLGGWTEAQFAQAVRFGQRPDGAGLSIAMPKFTIMSDEDIHAIWSYLKTVPVSENDVATLRAQQ